PATRTSTPSASPTWPRPSPRRPRTSTASSRWASTSSSPASSACSRSGASPARGRTTTPAAGRPRASPSRTPAGSAAEPAGHGPAPPASGPPLEDGEPAEAGRVEQGVGLGHPAAGRDGGQVADVGPLPPGPAGLLDQLVDAVGPQPLGLGGAGVGLAHQGELVDRHLAGDVLGDRKSTRLNSSHVKTSYAVLCL